MDFKELCEFKEVQAILINHETSKLIDYLVKHEHVSRPLIHVKRHSGLMGYESCKCSIIVVDRNWVDSIVWFLNKHYKPVIKDNAIASDAVWSTGDYSNVVSIEATYRNHDQKDDVHLTFVYDLQEIIAYLPMITPNPTTVIDLNGRFIGPIGRGASHIIKEDKPK